MCLPARQCKKPPCLCRWAWSSISPTQTGTMEQATWATSLPTTSSSLMGSPSITSRQVQAQLHLLLQPQRCSSHASSVLQIRCRGRGQAPDAAAANEFCWALVDFGLYLKEADLKRWVVVHCTHGYNRTGRWLCKVSAEEALAIVARLCTASMPTSFSS